ncbi:anti-sigma factor [Mesorhizobium sp. LHD-90]|uniref:anti-sigma factor n=1 Tax=Mesorhizobium sp. LHD-90 TaxID=3071414 RepID=UPI0027DF4866|nr:anti-sigma factor [Mesorhizobium sp. LHD-90]MDQ6435451.1 anti-sigma factor [Mesorhizobium sp. LHD-90]
MSIADDHRPDEGGDDLVAAEFVLGVLPVEERAAAARRIGAEPDFLHAVERWEGHFAPMASAYAPVEPPASVKAAIDRRLFSQQPAAAARPSSFWSSLTFWRGLAAAAVAALLLAVAIPYMGAPVGEPRGQLVASLVADGSDVRYLAVYDPSAGEVSLSHVSGERAAGKDFQLWTIEGGNIPVSMGVIPSGQAVRLPVDPAFAGKLTAGVKLAISLEPAGGSPTGQPTGPVVSVGDLFRL